MKISLSFSESAVPVEKQLVIVGRRVGDAHAADHVAFVVVRPVKRAVARQMIVRPDGVAGRVADAAGVVRFGLVGRRVRAAVGRRDDLRGFVVPVGG